MADEIQLKVDTSALDEALSKLPKKVSIRVMRKALLTAGETILDAMKANAPVRTDEPTPNSSALPEGILREDLSTQVTVSESKGAFVRVGPTALTAHVARWQENGWILTSHEGKKIKQIPGKHFMAASFDESAETALDAFIGTLAEGIAAATEDDDAD